MSIKGYSSGSKLDRLKQEFGTIEPVRLDQHALSVIAHEFMRVVGTDTAETGSTVESIVATAHAAQKGDVIRFTSGALSGVEVKVASTSTNAIVPGEDLASAPANTDAFQILRHKYPTVTAAGEVNVSGTFLNTPVQFVLNSVDTEVNEDTGTPANNIPLPVKLIDTSGNINRVSATQSGTWNINNVSGTVSLPTGAATEATLAAASAKLPAALGQAAMAASLAVVVASDQSAIPASQSGTWNINNVAGTVSLPTGAATEATLAAASAKLPAALGQAAMAASMAVVIASDQSAVPASQSGTWNINNVSGTISLPTGAATEATLSAASAKLPAALGQSTMANSLTVAIASDQSAVPASQSGTWSTRTQDGSGNTISSTANALHVNVQNATLAATQSGNWSTRTQDGSGNAITSASLGSNRGLHTSQLGFTAVDKARNDYTGTSVTSAAYVQLKASLAAECQEVEIFDSSGQPLYLATGAGGAEVDQVYIFPGGNGRIPLRIASGTRVALKAVGTTASTGEILVNFYG
jgi:hypothetical protein